MPRPSLLSLSEPPRRGVAVREESQPALSVVTVYQDPLARDWETTLWERVEKLVGEESLYRRRWSIAELTERRIFEEAVELAVRADVVVISVRDTGELPVILCAWADSWLPLRRGREGALVGLIGVATEPGGQPGRVYEYLESLARGAGLDFLPREHRLPGEPREGRKAQGMARGVPGRSSWGKRWVGRTGRPMCAED